MGMSESELGHVVDALQELVDAPLEGVWQPRRDRVILALGARLLLLVPRGPEARLHTVARRDHGPNRPFSFQGACRAHLRGALRSLVQWPAERVVDLRFDHGQLHLRLTGRSGGLWLLAREGVVAAYDGPAPAELPPLGAGGQPRQRLPRFQPSQGQSWDVAARQWFSGVERRRREEVARSQLRQRLRGLLARERRLEERLREDLRSTARAEHLRLQAQTLATHLHRIPPGYRRLSLPHPEEEGVWVDLEVDPALPPAHAMDQLFGRARRLERSRSHLRPRLEQATQRVARLAEELDGLGDLDAEALGSLARRLPRPAGARPGERAERANWDTWTGPHGERVLVGRDSRGNRRLTFQVARGHDTWMHLRDGPGAHLIIPASRGHSPPLDTLLVAAQIALRVARIPEGITTEVRYTQVRHVRSIPGEPGGRVTLSRERVLAVRRDESVLGGWVRAER